MDLIRRMLLRAAAWCLLLVLVLAAAGLVTARALLLSSLARDSGQAAVLGLGGPVVVERDARGVPRIRSDRDDPADLAAALGFVHAQERFFQMDLMRRRASGELAELLGQAGLASDRAMRRLHLRKVSSGVVERLPERHRRLLAAYAAGVNAGLDDLGARPPEHLVLAQPPARWTLEDCVLVGLAMHHGLSFGGRFELQYDALVHDVGRDVADFLMPETARFDAPLIGQPGDVLGPRPIPPLPPRTAERSEPPDRRRPESHDAPPAGSNQWAVAGSRTADGRAILANDMHLVLTVPGTWFHAQMEWGSGPDRRFAVGLTLPGVPGIIAGSNGRVAWGYTNTTGDFEDYVRVETDPIDPLRYRFGPGENDYEPFGVFEERIKVRGGEAERLTVRTTRWGPITEHDPDGQPLALRWPALDPATVNFNILDMMTADTIEQAVEVARSWWGPPQNVAIASADGRIAWVVSGWIPKRRGFDGRRPVSWAEPGVGWDGPIDEDDRPVLIDPPLPTGGVIYSANARMLPIPQSRLIGWCWASGERAGRIAELLRGRSGLTERDMLRMQLDTRAAMFDPIRDLVLECVPADDPDPLLRAARRAVEAWNGCADADQAGFRVLVGFRQALGQRLVEPFWSPVRLRDREFRYWCFQSEEPLLRILEDRPAALLPAGSGDWARLFRDALKESLGTPAGDDFRKAYSWGRINTARIRHPFSLAVPVLGRFLDMPRDELPGHMSTVRVQTQTFGASERMVVSPGREEDGILHLPCGQSGHPLSRHYSDGQSAWVRGEPRPLLAGPPVRSFRLVPDRRE